VVQVAGPSPAPQTLSDQIRRLEHQLDVVLFTRNSRHVALTADGRRLLVDAQHALSAFNRLVDGRGGHGLRLGAVKDYGPALPLIEEFRRVQPNCSIDIVDASSDEQLDALRAGASTSASFGSPPVRPRA
jgi:DNA-binding transcriptional LysR family regulator